MTRTGSKDVGFVRDQLVPSPSLSLLFPFRDYCNTRNWPRHMCRLAYVCPHLQSIRDILRIYTNMRLRTLGPLLVPSFLLYKNNGCVTRPKRRRIQRNSRLFVTSASDEWKTVTPNCPSLC